jgi:type II secretory pathway pseudopilin PulG
MTLIELMATIAIMAILMVAAIPSFRGLQARESMSLAQQGIQSLLYRMQQLSLAPPTLDESKYQILGYGLAFQKKGMQAGGCVVNAPNDYLAVYKFVVVRNNGSGAIDSTGQIRLVLNAFDPLTPCGPGGAINVIKYPKDFYILPNNVVINQPQTQSLSSPSTSLPWLLPMPLQSAGDQYGDLSVPNTGYNNPLPANNFSAAAQLVIQQTYIKVGSEKLCRSIKFSHDTQGVLISTHLVGGC